MHLAVRNNSVEIVEVLLAFGADPLRTDSRGNTCLHIAVEFRAWETLRTILEIAVKHTDDVDATNSSGELAKNLQFTIHYLTTSRSQVVPFKISSAKATLKIRCLIEVKDGYWDHI